MLTFKEVGHFDAGFLFFFGAPLSIISGRFPNFLNDCLRGENYFVVSTKMLFIASANKICCGDNITCYGDNCDCCGNISCGCHINWNLQHKYASLLMLYQQTFCWGNKIIFSPWLLAHSRRWAFPVCGVYANSGKSVWIKFGIRLIRTYRYEHTDSHESMKPFLACLNKNGFYRSKSLGKQNKIFLTVLSCTNLIFNERLVRRNLQKKKRSTWIFKSFPEFKKN